MTDYRSYISFPLGIRNNNPGNLVYVPSIKWKGQIGANGRFAVFNSVEYGIRAMAIDLKGDINKDGLNTITKLITSYAPPSENDTTAYINRVSRLSGIAPNTKIGTDNDTLFKLIKAQIAVEIGGTAYLISDTMIRNGIALMGGGNISPAVKNTGIVLIMILILIAGLYFIFKK